MSIVRDVDDLSTVELCMSKLFKLKEWLTLEEAVGYISTVLGEPITLADVYRLALDGHLRLSTLFVNGAKAKRVRLLRTEDVRYKEFVPKIPDFPKGKCFRIPQNVDRQISKDYWIQNVEPDLLSMRGVWDLAMIGAERAEIANRYYQLTSNQTVKIPMLIGHYLEKDGDTYQLQVKQASHPESLEDNEPTSTNTMQDNEVMSLQEVRLKMKPRGLPQYAAASNLSDYEHTLVLRTSEINRFIRALEDVPTPNKSSESNAKNSRLCLMAALLSELDYDWNQRGVSTSLVAMTELHGTPLGYDTIRQILKEIDSAVDSRRK